MHIHKLSLPLSLSLSHTQTLHQVVGRLPKRKLGRGEQAMAAGEDEEEGEDGSDEEEGGESGEVCALPLLTRRPVKRF